MYELNLDFQENHYHGQSYCKPFLFIVSIHTQFPKAANTVHAGRLLVYSSLQLSPIAFTQKNDVRTDTKKVLMYTPITENHTLNICTPAGCSQFELNNC